MILVYIKVNKSRIVLFYTGRCKRKKLTERCKSRIGRKGVKWSVIIKSHMTNKVSMDKLNNVR